MAATTFDKTLTILVVDDDIVIAELLRTVLNQVPGWGAMIVHDAAAAQNVYRHIAVEVLLVDVDLPDMSGLELLELLRRDAHWTEPAVLLMSARAEQQEITAAVQSGQVTRFVPKPFEVDRLLGDVREAALRHRNKTQHMGN